MNICWRRAELTDAEFYFNLVNDPECRKSAFNTKDIPFDEHREWFVKKIYSPDSRMFVLEAGRNQVGQVRFDKRTEQLAEIDVAVSKDFRRFGIASHAIPLICRQILKEKFAHMILARVKKDNKASLKTFKKSGFVRKSEENKAVNFYFHK